MGSSLYAQSCDFNVSSTFGCAPYTVNFLDNSSPVPIAWTWDFGDGNTSTSKDPSNTYYTSSSYTVTLEVTFSGGNKVSTTKTNYISIYTKPTANFSASNVSGCEDLPVSFTNKSTKGSGAITKYFYDFGNTFSDTNQNPINTYRTPGVYDVKLIVTDVYGCQDVKEIKGLVNVLPIPTANFASGQQIGCSYPHQVNFVNTTTANAAGSITYDWDFGNGNYSIVKTPSTSYQISGNFNVRLIATNALGCKDTIIKPNFIKIQLAKASFNSLNEVGCPPLLANFSSTSTPVGGSYKWSFGSVANSNAADTSVLFKNSGNYTVKLVYTSTNGCVDSLVKTGLVQVSPAPNATFYADDSTACRKPHKVNFTSLGTIGASWLWDFGDGTISTQRNPAKTYPDTGKFTVRLQVVGSNGCIDSFRSNNLIKVGPPRANFSPTIEEGCAPLKVGFSNNTISYAPMAKITYKFGDGGTSNLGYPNYTFKDTGLFLPWIIVTTDDGCVDSAFYDTIAVGMKPAANFMVDSSVGCRGLLTVKFTSLTNLGSVKANRFEWFPGTGAKLKGPEVSVIYTSPSGYYDVLLVALHNGCPDSLTKKNLIQVLTPTAQFTKGSGGCNDDSLFFKNQSLGGHYFEWSFGDGDSLLTDSFFDVSHIYPPGNFTAQLVVHDTVSGCYDTTDTDIIVESSDVLKFRSDTVGCTRSSIWFFDQTPGATKWIWKVGEAEICSTRNCQIYFKEPGWKDVIFSAIVQGCRYTTVKQKYVHIYGPQFSLLTPSDPICAPELVNIVTLIGGERPIDVSTKNLTIYKDWKLLETRKNFSDTTPYYFDQPIRPQDSVYRFFYSAKDTAGCYNYAVDTFHVYRPEVSFMHDRRATCSGDLQFFEATVLDTSSPKPYRFQWDFGDGIIETYGSTSVYHTYQNDSLYKSRLVVYDAIGCSDTVDQTLNIDVRNIKAAFVASDTFKLCPPLIVSFIDSSTNTYNGITEWNWTLGEGIAGNSPAPIKAYLEPGVFDISLKVTDSLGCSDSIYKTAYIKLQGTKVTYEIDTNYGCSPLTIKVKSTSLGQAAIQWNMRDGKAVVDSSSFTYVYTKAGEYVPSVFVKDVKGCQYVLVAKDTIKVAPTPTPNFSVVPTCFGQPSIFKNLTQEYGDTVSYQWYFTQNDSSTDFEPTFVFSTIDRNPVFMRATSIKGCADTITVNALISDPKGYLKVPPGFACATDSVRLELVNTGIGKVISLVWNFGDGNFMNSSDSIIKHVYLNKGFYKPSLTFVNEYGCPAQISPKDTVSVGDNFAPISSLIHRVSVDNNFQTSTLFEPNKSIDFDKYIIQRLLPSGKFDSIAQVLNPVDTLFLDAVPTLKTPYSYRVITKNVCGYSTDTSNLIPHTTVELNAQTAIDASLLEWTPYKGFPVLKYEIWRLNPGTGFQKLMEVNGNTLQTLDSNIACNTGYYYQVHAIGSGALQLSYSDTSGAIPNYIPFVPSNELFSASIEGNSKNLVQWSATSAGKAPVRYYILERSRNGVDYKETDRFDPFTTFTFDPVDSASLRSFYYRTIVQDTCGYKSEPSNFGKTMILQASVDALDQPQLNWTNYEYWEEGVDFYDIEIYENGNFSYLATVDGTTTSFIDDITELNKRPQYCYRITARSTADGGKTSRSSIACAPVRSRIFVPNAFRPLGGLEENSHFYPKGMYISEFHMDIYDRWGKLIFSTNSMDEGWDGMIDGKAAPLGVYIYKIDYRGVDKEFEMLSGNFLLLR